MKKQARPKAKRYASGLDAGWFKDEQGEYLELTAGDVVIILTPKQASDLFGYLKSGRKD